MEVELSLTNYLVSYFQASNSLVSVVPGVSSVELCGSPVHKRVQGKYYHE